MHRNGIGEHAPGPAPQTPERPGPAPQTPERPGPAPQTPERPGPAPQTPERPGPALAQTQDECGVLRPVIPDRARPHAP
ncbi:MAG: hypothetical protein CL938_00570 [Deltaproteobacteria bacterium]|nr:hypothetical protein [Deltaproteobacteria bacterium]